MELTETEREGVHCVRVAQDTDYEQCVSYRAGSFLISQVALTFSRRAMLHGYSYDKMVDVILGRPLAEAR
jgi:hypothetical protein